MKGNTRSLEHSSSGILLSVNTSLELPEVCMQFHAYSPEAHNVLLVCEVLGIAGDWLAFREFCAEVDIDMPQNASSPQRVQVSALLRRTEPQERTLAAQLSL